MENIENIQQEDEIFARKEFLKNEISDAKIFLENIKQKQDEDVLAISHPNSPGYIRDVKVGDLRKKIELSISKFEEALNIFDVDEINRIITEYGVYEHEGGFSILSEDDLKEEKASEERYRKLAEDNN